MHLFLNKKIISSHFRSLEKDGNQNESITKKLVLFAKQIFIAFNCGLQSHIDALHTHTHTHTHIYIYTTKKISEHIFWNTFFLYHDELKVLKQFGKC